MVAEGVRTKAWTVEEIERIVSLGLIDDPQRYELLEGDLFEKMPQKDAHWFGVSFALVALQSIFGVQQPIVCQGPLKLGEFDAPEPDIAILSRRSPRVEGHEVLIVVEVGETSLQFDLGRKARIYARHGIADYWVLDLIGRRLVIHRSPDPAEGIYREIRSYGEGESVAPLSAPNHPVSVASLLRQGE
ncbi:Uma2 family endonuclease [bacterium]|nr:MAG: Uma2 family endonuclease [bacterium]